MSTTKATAALDRMFSAAADSNGEMFVSEEKVLRDLYPHGLEKMPRTLLVRYIEALRVLVVRRTIS